MFVLFKKQVNARHFQDECQKFEIYRPASGETSGSYKFGSFPKTKGFVGGKSLNGETMSHSQAPPLAPANSNRRRHWLPEKGQSAAPAAGLTEGAGQEGAGRRDGCQRSHLLVTSSALVPLHLSEHSSAASGSGNSPDSSQVPSLPS